MTMEGGVAVGDSRAAEGRNRRVTISEIARHAGVSVGTVSHFLNASAVVAPATGERIRAAMEQLDYQPNLNARSLRSQTTRALGLVVPNIVNPYYAEIASLIGDRASELGYQLLLCSSNDDETRQVDHLRALYQRRVDGALVVAAGSSAVQRSTGQLPFLCLFVDRAIDGRPCVMTDNRLGGRLAMQHLLELGHRRIGLIVGDEDVANIQDRLEGVAQALSGWTMELDEDCVLTGPQSIDTGRQAAHLWEMSRPPTAVTTLRELTTDPQTRNYLQDQMGMAYLQPAVARGAFLRALSPQSPAGAMPPLAYDVKST
jgi:LacI family transcriptional regulator